MRWIQASIEGRKRFPEDSLPACVSSNPTFGHSFRHFTIPERYKVEGSLEFSNRNSLRATWNFRYGGWLRNLPTPATAEKQLYSWQVSWTFFPSMYFCGESRADVSRMSATDSNFKKQIRAAVFTPNSPGASVTATCYNRNEQPKSRYCLRSLVLPVTTVVSHYADNQAPHCLKMKTNTSTFDSSPTKRWLTLPAATIHFCGIDQFYRRVKANAQFCMLPLQSVLLISLSRPVGPVPNQIS